jgi:hypothetical protein
MASERKKTTFVVCIRNDACEDLELRKVYVVLEDTKATKEGYMRVIDESGEDYLYPSSYFVPVRLPQKVQEVLTAAS